MKIKKHKILLIVGGGISAYKSLDLIRILRKNNFIVKTILTKSGKEFVTPLSLTSLTQDKPYEDLFNITDESKIDHISLSRWSDLIIVVPTTANFMSKISFGKAEDLASTVILASNKDIILVPAMNIRMWMHKATQANYKKLLDYGYKFIGPTTGEMACGEYGEGKMSSPRQIYSTIKDYFKNKDLYKKKKLKALVTTGPTREYIDPIRYISNESSGKQGYEIALALSKAGIQTTLVAGPSNINPSFGLKIINVTTAEQMFKAVRKLLPVDIAICAAAVSDFKPKTKSNNKIKKNSNKLNLLNLEKNPDILEYLGKNNRYRPKFVVGFAAETEDLIKNAENKLKNKNCDLIIANDVSKKTFGFNKDFNKVVLIHTNGKKVTVPKNKKSYIASIITETILEKYLINDKSIN
jgi:phosphopantothenoylcysteine decarboxylase / phosphopantothenate---cysteine ligase